MRCQTYDNSSNNIQGSTTCSSRGQAWRIFHTKLTDRRSREYGKSIIREASLRLHIPQSAIRQCTQDGELKVYRQTSPDGRLSWVVELPEEGWTSAAMEIEMGRPFSPWWWADGEKAGLSPPRGSTFPFSMGRNTP